jgi:ABC-2 type transport system ATP-binding protein
MRWAVEAEGLTREFAPGHGTGRGQPFRALDGIDLRVADGEVLGVLGPNGAGKTTLVRVLSCLLQPTAGSARVAGHCVPEEATAVRQACGLTTEGLGLYEQFRALDYLLWFARLYRIPRAQAENDARALLTRAGLWERRGDRLGTFSKGMRQKVNIIRALLHRPAVVFLDEPTSGLDVEAAMAVREQILELRRDRGTTFVICTHNLPEAERLCDRLAVIQGGRILAVGEPAALKAGAGAAYVWVRLRAVPPALIDTLERTTGIERVEPSADGLRLRLSEPEQDTPAVVRTLVGAGAEILAVIPEGRSLEEVYLQLVREGRGMARAALIFVKDLKEAFGQRSLWYRAFIATALMPVFFAFTQSGGLHKEAMRQIVFPLDLLALAFTGGTVAIITAAAALAGEKERRTAEALLAAPVSDTELFVGKGLAAWLPGTITGYLAQGLFLATWWLRDPFTTQIMTPVQWSVVLAASPLMALVVACVGLIVSARSGTVLSAMQLRTMLSTPVAGGLIYLGYRALAGGVTDQALYYGAEVAAGLALAVIGVRVLNREAIVMRL